ncbi:MAG: ABC transporter permease [bacterium]|nr:ABC transporter permease [bacterium]
MIRDSLKSLSSAKKGIVFLLLSISITIACIIFLFSIPATVKREILTDIENIGANILRVSPDYYDKEGLQKRYNITYDDLLRLNLKGRCKGIKRIAVTFLPQECPFAGPDIKVEGEKHSFCPTNVNLLCTIPEYKEVRCLKVIRGRFINNLDVRLKRRVCVLGNTTSLFLGGKRLLGKKIILFHEYRDEKDGIWKTWFSSPFTVIGILARYNPFALPLNPYSDFWWGGWEGRNTAVIVPYSVFKEDLDLFVDDIFLKIATRNSSDINKEIKGIEERVKAILAERYGEDKIFYVKRESQRLLDELQSQTRQANTFILIIGAGGLIISIVSILSMMLLSVSKRTSEIGLRRAIGARKKDIFFQFLVEALVITGIGGISGIAFGVIGIKMLGYYASWKMVIPLYGIFIGFATSILIGVIGSLYPALKAARIPPAVAVKYE